MNLEELRKLADSFFEWPTEDRSQVTLTSAMLFAQHVLRMTQQQSDQDRLRFRSACEISGDKHPEYVRGYEAAMDAVCKAQRFTATDEAQPDPIPTSERVLLDLHRHLFEWTAATPIGEEDNQRGASVYNWRRHFTQYVWNYIQGLKRPAEPQGGAE